MKKIGKFFVLMIVALICAATFTSCNDDDDEPGSSSGNGKLVGTWQGMHNYFICKEDGKIVEEYDEDYDIVLLWEFTSEGRLIVTDDGIISSLKYTLSGDKIKVSGNFEGEEGSTEFYIKKLNDKTLEIETTFKEKTDEGVYHEEYSYATFVRVK